MPISKKSNTRQPPRTRSEQVLYLTIAILRAWSESAQWKMSFRSLEFHNDPNKGASPKSRKARHMQSFPSFVCSCSRRTRLENAKYTFSRLVSLYIIKLRSKYHKKEAYLQVEIPAKSRPCEAGISSDVATLTGSAVSESRKLMHLVVSLKAFRLQSLQDAKNMELPL